MKFKKLDDRQLPLFGLFDLDVAVEEPPVEVAEKSELASAVEAVYSRPKERRQLFSLDEKTLEGLDGPASKVKANVKAIETVLAVMAEHRKATNDEKNTMARFTGWGGLSEVFANNSDYEWAKARLKELLTPDQYRAAEESVLTAYYTEPHVARAMWAMVRALGFEGGAVMEPSCAVGHFIGAMPKALREASTIKMVEIDPISADIATALYADRDTRCYNLGIEQTRHVSSMDLVIGNVPFGNYRVRDDRFDRLKLNIHDYFIAKALDMVRPGGLVALITTSATMDGASKSAFRDHITRLAEVKTVVRLPAGAFGRLGGTDVVADILVLQRRLRPLEFVATEQAVIRDIAAIPYPMIAAGPMSYAVGKRLTNRYFHENPENVLGKFTLGSTRWGDSVTVKAEEGWEERLAAMASKLLPSFDPALNVRPQSEERKRDPKGLKSFVAHGFFFDEEGRLMKISANNSVENIDQLPAATVKRIEGMTRIRDCTLRLLEADARAEAAAEKVRVELNALYDGFVEVYGPLMGQTNQRLYREDTHAPLLWSLELWDEENECARKAEVFSRCTVSRATLAETAQTLEDAIALSYNRNGCLDTGFAAKCLGQDEEEVIGQLVAAGRVFIDPETGRWTDSLDYLSGKVREKLKAAQAAARSDSGYERNVAALQAVVPPNIPIQSVAVRLGVPWLESVMVEEWLCETFGIGVEGDFQHYEVSVSHAKESASWAVSFKYPKAPIFHTEWGTKRKGFWALLENLLHQKTPEVHDEIEVGDGKTRLVINRDETIAAQEKAEKIQESFSKWLVADEGRAAHAEAIYNDLYNGVVNRVYDGSHLVVPGLNPAIGLRQAQKDSIWRGIVSGNTLYALAVGAGKTLIQIVLAQECKRLGLANKPVLVVPNHMLHSFAGEYLRAFPRAKVLAASKDDMQGDARRTLLMRIAVNDWDAVIMTHSTFGKMHVGSDHVKAMIREVKDQARESVMGVDDRNLVREAQRAALQAENTLKGLIRGDQDAGVPGFETLGIDMLVVDEADLFKALYFFTRKKRIPGINSAVSQRAMDLFVKSRVVFERRGDETRGLVFSTATPISNTMGELFVMQTYLQQARLRELGIDNFDAWSANFAREVTCVEVKPEGSGYRLHTRFAQFVNVPELMLIFREVAEIRTKRQLNLPEPKLNGGGHEIVAVPASEAQEEFVRSLVRRAELIRNGLVKPDVDNMLCVTGDGRKAALDIRCVDPLAACDRGSKVNACIDRVYDFWLAGREERTTQLVFCDLSVPGPVFSVYEYIREELIERGVPPDEIAFAQDFKTDAQKAKFHRRVRAGKVRVAIGSTELMGFGTNVQDRLIAEHHLDAPWRPRDVEQRDGRIIRQGNMFDSVYIVRYVTSGTFDAYSWQTLERKATFIAQVMENDGIARTIEDVSTQALSYAEVKALASGNPLVIEKAAVDAEVAKLVALENVHSRGLASARHGLYNAERDLEQLTKRYAAYTAFMEVMQVQAGHANVNNLELPAEAAGKAIMDRMAALRKSFKASLRNPRWKAREEVLFTTGNLVVGLYLSVGSFEPVFRAALQGMQLENGYWVDLPYGAEKLVAMLNEGSLTDQMRARGEYLPGHIQSAREAIERFKALLATPFEHEARLLDALSRKAQIDAELEIDLDDNSAMALEKVD